MNWESLAGLIRHILTFGGGFLVTEGHIDENTLQAAIGAVITLGGIAWSFWAKKGVKV